MNEPTTELIPVKLIDDPTFNSRGNTDTNIPKLAASIKAGGLLNPIVVVRLPTGRFRLRAGSRRLAAVKHNGDGSIRATVFEEPSDQSSSSADSIANIIENLQREDLSTYDTARSLAHLRSLGLSIRETTEATGYSKNRISALVVQYEGMPNELKEHWSKGDPLFTTPFLEELNRIDTPEEKITFYKERKELHTRLNAGYGDSDEEDEKPKKNKKAASSVSVRLDKYTTLRKALIKIKGEQVAVQAIDYLIGEKDSLPGIIDPVEIVDGVLTTTKPTNHKPTKKKGK